MSNLFNLLSAMCGKIKKADLSQNDPEAADYVKGVIRKENLPEGYPYKEQTETVIMPETEFTTVSNGNVVDTEFESTIELIAGNTYNVTFNGTKYTCVAPKLDGAVNLLGNAYFASSSLENTGEPFLLGFNGDAGMLMTETAGTYTISITDTVTTYTKMAEEFLPDGVPALMKVTVTEHYDEDNNVTYSADKTYDEITEHLKAGGDVICLYAEGVFQLSFQYGPAFTDVSTYVALDDQYKFMRVNGNDVFWVNITKRGDGTNTVKYGRVRLADYDDVVHTPSTASVGQTIVVKAVDDAGKPTEWEAVDMVAKRPHAIITENDGQYELAIFVDLKTGKFVTESTAETVRFDPEGALSYGLPVSYQNDNVTSNLIGMETPGDGTYLLTFWDIINNEQLRLSYDIDTKEISKYTPPPV